LLVGFVWGILAMINSGGAYDPVTHLIPLPAVTAVYGLIAVQICRAYPRHVIGWLMAIISLSAALTFFSSTFMNYNQFVTGGSGSMLANIIQWLNSWVWYLPSTVPIVLLPIYFPTGQLLSSRWRLLVYVATLGIVLGCIAYALQPPSNSLMFASGALMLPGTLGGLAAIVIRYRKSGSLERQQRKWLLYAVGCTVAILLFLAGLSALQPDPTVLGNASTVILVIGISLIGFAIGAAILRHQLWDIDNLINKTLVYSILSIITASIYLIVVTFFSALFEGNDQLFALVATAMVALSFQSVREFVQRAIDRAMFGDRDDPYSVVDNLVKKLQPIVTTYEILPAIAQTIGEGLRLPYVAVNLIQKKGYRLIAQFPEQALAPPDEHVTKLSLDYQANHIGQLWLAHRSQDEQFTEEELKLLTTLARQVSVAAYNVTLTEKLQHSREELVTTREDERRRLRRDLHDVLGPVLASMSLGLDAIQNLADSDKEMVNIIAAGLKDQVQTSLFEVRRIAYALRPPALDELGLVGALREHFNSLGQSAGPRIEYSSSQKQLVLPAAVEVAAYRIALEAVTNVQRHALASNCHVDLMASDTSLMVRVADDGVGLPEKYRAGVGMTSMRERAEELGGDINLIRLDPGLQIEATLPIP
jgi:signal transduction histidine kinase